MTVPDFRRDLALLLLGLMALAFWEWLGADLMLVRAYGSLEGFALRDHPLLSKGLHEGGRLLAWAMIVLLAWEAWFLRWSGPSRRLRWLAIALVLLATVFISTLKRLSDTSCPWDLAEFGGQWPYVPHWLLQVRDGGPGHCFPSGHASAAFAFLLAWSIWRPFNAVVARRMLALILLLGSLFAWVQMVRGAHFLSHSLWTAWICWAMSTLAAWVLVNAQQARRQPGPSSGPTSSSPPSI